MTEWAPFILVALLVVPLVGAVVTAVFGKRSHTAARGLAFGFVCLNFVLTAALSGQAVDDLIDRADRPLSAADAVTFHPLYETKIDLLALGPQSSAAPHSVIRFDIGLDGLNLWLVVLTSLLMIPSVLISWNAIRDRANEFYAWLLILQVAMTGVFLAFDVVLFYVFFELTLVPLYFLIGIWGGPMRREAARKFFLFTLTGSLITLLGVIGVILVCYHNVAPASGGSRLTFAIPELITQVQYLVSRPGSGYGLSLQIAIFLAMSLGFAVKVPLFPLHTWLPLAHVEAPTAGSVLLAGVLLKLGTYGFLRLAWPLAPDAVLAVGVPLLGTLACIGIIYGALCAFAQRDIKKLVAYSSVSHLGFCVLGLVALNRAGLTGALLQMVNHGLSTGGLFLLVGMIYERYHTRMISDYGGMAARLKIYSAFMVFICLTSVGMPGLNGFVGEMLVLAGVYDLRDLGGWGSTFAVVVAIGIVLGAWYLFTMLMNVFFGPLREPEHHGEPITDLNQRELATILLVAIPCLLLGLFPQPVIEATRGDIAVVARIADQAHRRAQK
jgi:NADH-quinone oxidoreductase subunit M